MSISRLTGHKLAGLYHLGDIVAHGTRSVLYEARHVFTGARYAVKVFRREVLSEEALGRVRRDGEMVQALHHPGVARVLEWSRPAVLPLAYLVMELLAGENLQSRVRRLGRLPPPEVLQLALRLGQALQAAHKLGVVHRGLTPRNVIYVRPEEGGAGQGAPLSGATPRQQEVVKVLDFGVAHLPPPPDMEEELLPYLAPELTRGEQADPRSDQYAMAALLYEALSGQPPPLGGEIEVEGAPPPSLLALCPEAPPAMTWAVERALSPVPVDRFPSIADFMRALDDRGPHPFRGIASSTSVRVALSASSGRGPLGRREVGTGPNTSALPGSWSGASPALRAPAGGLSARSLPSVNSLSPVAVQELEPAAARGREGRRPWRLLLSLSAVAAVSFYLGTLARPGPGLGGPPPVPPPRLRVAAAPPPVPPAPSETAPAASETPPDLLAAAEEALGRGEHSRAIELARPSVPSVRAWRVIATAACRRKDGRLLEEALAQLGETDRAAVQAGCSGR